MKTSNHDSDTYQECLKIGSKPPENIEINAILKGWHTGILTKTISKQYRKPDKNFISDIT